LLILAWPLSTFSEASTKSGRGLVSCGTVQVAEVFLGSPAFSCRSDCQQTIDATATVRLVAIPDAGWNFDGWQGACSGTAACDVAMGADHDLVAAFSVSPPPPPGNARVTVTFVGNGSGRVTSSPGGIDCPSTTCSMTVRTNTAVSLSAQPDSSSSFVGWGGTCSGNGGCSVTASSDLNVSANFAASAPPAPPPQCVGLSPGSQAPQAVSIYSPAACAPGLGDATGTLGLQALNSPRGVTLHIVDGSTQQQKSFTSNWDNAGGSFTQQPSGFTGVMKYADVSSLHYFNRDGSYVSASWAIYGKLAFMASPAGGVLLAGDFSWYSDAPRRHQAWFFGRNQGSTYLSWSHDLASPGAVFGLGCDLSNSCLVITDGGSGNISGQWFDSTGTALTGEFSLLSGFQAASDTWFETAPLIGGGVAVRRVDQADSGRPFQRAAWLVTLGAGKVDAQPAPQWMKDRPNTQLAVARSGKAYAVLPMGAPDADCAQKVEVMAPDGTSCGSFDIGIASGKCRTENVSLSLDGTPIQLMPRELSQPYTCSYRSWLHALQ
jgi:hypothetical protein